MNDRIVRIGGASASLADSAIAFPQLLGDGALDYLVGDYLAEGSMGLLAMLAQANPGGGYAPDFIPVHIGPCLAEIARQAEFAQHAPPPGPFQGGSGDSARKKDGAEKGTAKKETTKKGGRPRAKRPKQE